MSNTIVAPCLLCDAPTEVLTAEYDRIKEAPIVLCSDCNRPVVKGTVPWPMVKMIYLLRCQVAALAQKVEVLESGVRQLMAKPE